MPSSSRLSLTHHRLTVLHPYIICILVYQHTVCNVRYSELVKECLALVCLLIVFSHRLCPTYHDSCHILIQEIVQQWLCLTKEQQNILVGQPTACSRSHLAIYKLNNRILIDVVSLHNAPNVSCILQNKILC